jgi:hypothetical protein
MTNRGLIPALEFSVCPASYGEWTPSPLTEFVLARFFDPDIGNIYPTFVPSEIQNVQFKDQPTPMPGLNQALCLLHPTDGRVHSKECR